MSLLLVKACPQRGTLQGVQCTPTPLIFEAVCTSLVQMTVGGKMQVVLPVLLRSNLQIGCVIDEFVLSFSLSDLN